MTTGRKSFSPRLSVVLLAGLGGLGVAVTAAGPALLTTPGPLVEVARVSEDPPGPRASQAVQVSVERTRGGNEVSVFQTAGGGSRNSELMRLASSPEFRALAPRYAPANKKGRYRYEVTVRYRDGKKKRVVTYSGTPGTPQVLLDLIDKSENMPIKLPVFPPGFPFN